MLKTSLKFFICLSIIVCLHTIISVESPASADRSFVAKLDSLCCFSVDTDAGTYDARDKFNRPIRDIKAKQQLAALFMSGLYSMLVVSEQHYSVELIAVIQKLLSSANKFINRNAGGVCAMFVQAVLPQLRKFFLQLSAIVFFTLQLFSTLHIFSHLYFTPKSKVAPLILRC
jgi:hypothetical protein